MGMTDPIADMLTRLRNASSVFHDAVDVPASRLKKELSRILKEEGYIRDFKVAAEPLPGTIRIYLKYASARREAIQGIKRVSKPGRRVYAKQDQIPRVLDGLGIAVLSTSRGVMSDRQAREYGVGGEVL